MCAAAGLCSAKWASSAGNSAAVVLWVTEEAEIKLFRLMHLTSQKGRVERVHVIIYYRPVVAPPTKKSDFCSLRVGHTCFS